MAQNLFGFMTLVLLLHSFANGWQHLGTLSLGNGSSYTQFLTFKNKPCIVFSRQDTNEHGEVTSSDTKMFGMMCYENDQWKMLFEYSVSDSMNIGVNDIQAVNMIDSLFFVWTEYYPSSGTEKTSGTIVCSGWYKNGAFKPDVDPVCIDTQFIYGVIAADFRSEPIVLIINRTGDRSSNPPVSLWLSSLRGTGWTRSEKKLAGIPSGDAICDYTLSDSSLFMIFPENERYSEIYQNEEYDLGVYAYSFADNSIKRIFIDSTECWNNAAEMEGMCKYESNLAILYYVLNMEEDSATVKIKSYSNSGEKMLHQFILTENNKGPQVTPQLTSVGSSLFLHIGCPGTNDGMVTEKVGIATTSVVTDTLRLPDGCDRFNVTTDCRRYLHCYSDTLFHYIVVKDYARTSLQTCTTTLNIFLASTDVSILNNRLQTNGAVHGNAKTQRLKLVNMHRRYTKKFNGHSLSGKKLPSASNIAGQVIVTPVVK